MGIGWARRPSGVVARTSGNLTGTCLDASLGHTEPLDADLFRTFLRGKEARMILVDSLSLLVLGAVVLSGKVAISSNQLLLVYPFKTMSSLQERPCRSTHLWIHLGP